MTKITANLLLIMLAATWCWLSIQSGTIIEVSDKFLYACGILVSGNIGEELAKKYKGGGS